MRSSRLLVTLGVLSAVGAAAGDLPVARAQAALPERTVTFRFVPTTRAQLALWVESADGTHFATVGLTDATARRGIGNRPGASQMNSGYRWPYGRREGVLPVWAHRRAAVRGAMLFPRVIFQDRGSEGFASNTSEDSTPDRYSCLPFSLETTRRDGLDAVTCASAFSGDKGRFVREADVQAGYGEPYEEAGAGTSRPLDATSLYPPRSDVVRCAGAACSDSADVDAFAAAARGGLPDLDAIAMATPPAATPQAIVFAVPGDWPSGSYVAYLEINTEGDYNASYDARVFPTPSKPVGAWDSWAQAYGYPFRGQPSVIFRLEIQIGQAAAVAAREAYGYGSLSGHGPAGGAIRPIDSTISDDPVMAPGSGVDRLGIWMGGNRLMVETRVYVPGDGGVGVADGSGSGDDAAVSADAAAETDRGDSGTGAGGDRCVPGRTVACPCPGGAADGTQTCSADGRRYEACACSAPPPKGASGCGCAATGSVVVGDRSPLVVAIAPLVLFALALSSVLGGRRYRCGRRRAGAGR